MKSSKFFKRQNLIEVFSKNTRSWQSQVGGCLSEVTLREGTYLGTSRKATMMEEMDQEHLLWQHQVPTTQQLIQSFQQSYHAVSVSTTSYRRGNPDTCGEVETCPRSPNVKIQTSSNSRAPNTVLYGA